MRAAPAKICPSCGERYEADVLFCSRDGTPLALGKNPGGTPSSPDGDPYLNVELAGQIVLKSLIGIGSMGRVYRAWQGGIERDVAVKILHRELSGNTELVKRFHREAKVASRLVHPNVVQVLMTGIAPFASTLSSSTDPSFIGGELYLVMEHLDGISLLSALAAAGTSGEAQALPLPRALHIALQLCDAVGEAHMQKIVHRDLKPENVMLVRRGEDRDYVKVLDFGIARLDWNDKGMETQAGLIFGSAKYISPEGADGQAVGPEADVYSIATMLYQMLAGRTPFEGESPVAILVQHAHTPPLDLREIPRASYVPAPIAGVIMQNLAKRPRDRAPDARQLRRDLMAAARASGLFPEELGAQVSLGEGALSVKLASNQRTKALELSVDLAKKIGGVAAPTQEPIVAARSETPPPRDTQRTSPPASARASAPASARAALASASAGPTHPSSTAVLAGPPAGAPRTRKPAALLHEIAAELDFDDAAATAAAAAAADAEAEAAAADANEDEGYEPVASGPPALPRSVPVAVSSRPVAASASRPGGTEPPSAAPSRPRGAAPSSAPVSIPSAPPSARASQRTAAPALATVAVVAAPSTDATIQGTEQSLEPDDDAPTMPRWKRIALTIAVVAAVAPIAVLGGRALGGLATGRSSDGVEATLDRGREAMHRHAWTAPAESNVKDLLGAASTKWPQDPRVQQARRDAAEMLVSDALGRKYAADVPEAIRLAKLALELDPGSTTAQHLVAELEGATPHAAPGPGDGRRGAHVATPHPAAELPEPAPPTTSSPPSPSPSSRVPRTQTPTSTGPWL